MPILVLPLHVTSKCRIALALVFTRGVAVCRWVSASDRLKSDAQRMLLQVGRDNLKKVQIMVWEIKSGDHFLVDEKNRNCSLLCCLEAHAALAGTSLMFRDL